MDEPQFIYGNRLIGYLPCSDSFGVDLILENYQKDLTKKKEEAERKAESGSASIHEQTSPDSRKPKSEKSVERGGLIAKHERYASQNPENLNDMVAGETSEMDRSQRSSAGFASTMPLRVTTKGEEIQMKEA